MYKLLKEFKNIFHSSLLDELPPKRDIEHEIETENIALVNIWMYFIPF